MAVWASVIGVFDLAALKLTSAMQITPNKILVMGPTTAIRNSAFGVAGSRSIFETPPKRKSVIRRTGNPCALATSECDNSCRRMETKKSKDEATATPHRNPAPHSGCQEGNSPEARLQVIRRKIKIQLPSM